MLLSILAAKLAEYVATAMAAFCSHFTTHGVKFAPFPVSLPLFAISFRKETLTAPWVAPSAFSALLRETKQDAGISHTPCNGNNSHEKIHNDDQARVNNTLFNLHC